MHKNAPIFNPRRSSVLCSCCIALAVGIIGCQSLDGASPCAGPECQDRPTSSKAGAADRANEPTDSAPGMERRTARPDIVIEQEPCPPPSEMPTAEDGSQLEVGLQRDLGGPQGQKNRMYTSYRCRR